MFFREHRDDMERPKMVDDIATISNNVRGRRLKFYTQIPYSVVGGVLGIDFTLFG